jgi:hypothetical protein
VADAAVGFRATGLGPRLPSQAHAGPATQGEGASSIHFDLRGKEFPLAHLNLFNSTDSIVTVSVIRVKHNKMKLLEVMMQAAVSTARQPK